MLCLEKKFDFILDKSLTKHNTQKIISTGPRITEKLPLKKLKILSFLAPFISKIETADIFNFLSVKYFGKGLLFLKIWHIKVSYCWSYGPLHLLFRFFRYPLGHLDNRQTKIAENSTIYFLRADTKMFAESFKVFDPPITKWRSFKFFLRNWTETTF